MYEVGIRHSFSFPIVQICQSGEILPFDLADERTIFFDINSLDEISEAKEKIARAARRAIDARPFRSPVVRALELDTLFSDADATPLSRSLIEKLDDLSLAIEEVQSDINSLESGLEDLPSRGSDDYLNMDRVNELLRIFDQVGPQDLARLVLSLK